MMTNTPMMEGEGEDMMPMPGPTPAAVEQAVPLSALALPGEDQKMTNPEPGDDVVFEVAGTVSRIEGDTAFIKVKSVNGQEMQQPADPAAMPGAGELDNLMGEAEAQGVL